eukprot:281124_1
MAADESATLYNVDDMRNLLSKYHTTKRIAHMLPRKYFQSNDIFLQNNNWLKWNELTPKIIYASQILGGYDKIQNIFSRHLNLRKAVQEIDFKLLINRLNDTNCIEIKLRKRVSLCCNMDIISILSPIHLKDDNILNYKWEQVIIPIIEKSIHLFGKTNVEQIFVRNDNLNYAVMLLQQEIETRPRRITTHYRYTYIEKEKWK